MLDDQHRELELGGERLQQLGELVDLTVAEAGSGLVQAQQPGRLTQRAGQLDALELAVGEAGDGTVGDGGEAHAFQRLVRVGGHRRLFALDEREMQRRRDETGAVPVMRAEHHVLAHGERRDEREVLERAGDAEPGDLVRLALEHLHAVEPDRAGGRFSEAAQAVEQRRLARAVGADQAAHLAVVDRQLHVVERLDSPKAD